MFTSTIWTAYTPRLEEWLDRSWSKVLALGLALLLTGIIVMIFARLVALLIALGLFFGGALALNSAYGLWQGGRELSPPQPEDDQ
ncbi:MAG: hypothetical protein IIB43_03625 [Candidatus Marinimicrobia bacterium]|nr:hypothetical protein [Candidatus Neomarinimicrobiota bacterium]MCH8023777.1 hypothetical protein [Candidatus Neomarinimicrobiota bacterium]